MKKTIKDPNRDQITFLELFQAFISHHSNARDQFDKRKSTTIQNYKGKYFIISKFIKSQGLEAMPAIDFNIDLSKKLAEWLSVKKHRKGKYSHNYIVRVRETCRLILQHGAVNNIISHNPQRHLKLKKDPPKSPPYLTIEELHKFENYSPDTLVKLQAHVMAIIQLHTGFDYSDLAELNRSQVVIHNNRKYIEKPRNKNGNEASVPISDLLNKYLEKYNYKVSLLSNIRYNWALKDIAKDLNLKIHLTSKTLRKLFLMNKLNNQGVSMESVSKMAGHRTLRTTEKYYASPNIHLIYKELDRLGLYKIK